MISHNQNHNNFLKQLKRAIFSPQYTIYSV
jgi:hypothetical protein